MAENLKNNPFSALFCNIEAAKQFSENQPDNSASIKHYDPADQTTDPICFPEKQGEASPITESSAAEKAGNDDETSLLEWLLLVTSTDPPTNTWHPCVFLPASDLSADMVNMALFERLLLEGTCNVVRQQDKLSCTGKWAYDMEVEDGVEETRVLYYLLGVYTRCAATRKTLRSSNKDTTAAMKVIQIVEAEVVTNLHTAVHHSELYFNQDVLKQFKEILLENLSESDIFDELIIAYLKMCDVEESSLHDVFVELLSVLERDLRECDLFTVKWTSVRKLEFYAQRTDLVEKLLTVPAPFSTTLAATPHPPGSVYQSTALGRLLAISCLPASPSDPPLHFGVARRLTKPEVFAMNASIDAAQTMLNETCHRMFVSMLSNKASKPLLLRWLSACLASNLGRTGLWHIAGGGAMGAAVYVSDGFMLNLGAVLARLAHKFTQIFVSGTDGTAQLHGVMKVDPSFCFSPDGPDAIPGSYPTGLHTLTTLVPHATQGGDDSTEGQSATPPLPAQYTFVTSCFFFANCALHLGLNVINQRLEKLQRDLGRLHSERGSFTDPEAQQLIVERIDALTGTYLTLRAALLPQAGCDAVRHLLAASAHWLVQISQTPMCPWDRSPRRLSVPVVTPVPESAASDPIPAECSWLQFVPEFIVDNIAQLSPLHRLLHDSDLGQSVYDVNVNNYLLSFVVAFMGSSGRIKNPHLRAELARTLELLGEAGGVGEWGDLLQLHPLAPHLPTALVRVFVSIEMTGQSVTFEDKFKYREPMYEIMRHLWQLPAQRAVFVMLSNEALGSMESTEPPLFLRFVNLLINDNIFLLDEGLTYMAQLREMQVAKDAGEWEALSPREMQQKEQMLTQTTMLARFHSVLARRTSSTLVMLAEEVAPLLCHKTLVDRVAGMLNFFLDHLVGPKQRSLKVRDNDHNDFRPGELVTLICRLYGHLSHHRDFGAAVIRDDRSYSPQLLDQAKAVLGRIGEHRVADSMCRVQRCVEQATENQQNEDDLTSAAPDRFLDPIMSVLMRDPVRLPSSGMVVERATIARHLLSDQTDPFNRQPLNMAEIVPDTKLRAEIQDWIHTRQRAGEAGRSDEDKGGDIGRSEAEKDQSEADKVEEKDQCEADKGGEKDQSEADKGGEKDQSTAGSSAGDANQTAAETPEPTQSTSAADATSSEAER